MLIQTLLSQISAKDVEISRHHSRVAALAVRIGEACGLSSEELKVLELAAALHDAGKLGVDDRILHKEAGLTEQEWLQMRRHVELGYRLLQRIPGFERIAEVVYCHHERWDGRGYPRRLAGEEIPFLARIVAVADAYDAMVNERPYRQAVSAQEAREELIREAGAQFDPEVVARFVIGPCSEQGAAVRLPAITYVMV